MRRRGRAEHGFAPVAEALLAAGADPALANREGYTAAQRARGPYGPPRHAVLAVVEGLDPGAASPGSGNSPATAARAPARVRRRPS